MSTKRPAAFVAVAVGLLALTMGITSQRLAAAMRFGLEFRGGYEIYYVVTPAPGKDSLTQDDLLATAKILQERADNIGMAEPEIHVEGDSHIRLKLAGLTSAEESRSLLGNSEGLPTTLTEKYTQTVGSVLGATALKETMTAGAIGIACIFGLLLFLYRALGGVAAFCTLLYLWILVIAFNAFHATLSLSAVVAFVLGIGMAADASIICFERVREELEKGLAPPEAVRAGFRGSFPTIRDANLVTALAMIALFVAGIGPIQGFSLTMIASLVISVLTNFFGVRELSLWLAETNLLSPKSLIGSSTGSGPRPKDAAKPRRTFDFVHYGPFALLFSATVIASGAVYYRAHGLNLDIDFTAGTALDIDLDRAIDQDAATKIMSDAGTVPATVAIGGKNNDHIAARFDEVLKPADLKAIIGAFQTQFAKVEYEENTADPGVAREFATRAIYAVFAAFASIGIYIAVRFSWAVALATVIPILHDIVLVSAIFALFKLEIDVTYVAAMLTVIGYSLNDKIVIFGRIRENTQGFVAGSGSLRQEVNISVQQTLGRSIYTVLTVVMAAACLYQFACEPLQMFALAILLGLIAGAYSSIFMSTLLWLAIRRSVALPWPVWAGLGAVSAAGITGWFALAAHPASVHESTTSVVDGSAASASPLGDLKPFAAIASDALALVNAGDLKGAKVRIKDLETAWDEAEETMEPKSPTDWTSVDKSIDRALAQLRSGAPVPTECVTSLNTLLAKLESMQGRN